MLDVLSSKGCYCLIEDLIVVLLRCKALDRASARYGPTTWECAGV
jgi:hypothetical protein